MLVMTALPLEEKPGGVWVWKVPVITSSFDEFAMTIVDVRNDYQVVMFTAA